MRTYKSHRVAAQRISPSATIAFAEAVRAHLRALPDLTVEELMRRTGAPKALVTRVRRLFRYATAPGVVP